MDCFGINRQWIVTIFKKLNISGGSVSDMRGKHNRSVSEAKIKSVASVKEHINSFPRIESHYLRKDSRREYLVGDLNVSLMYRLYIEWMAREKPDVTTASKRQYYDIFTNDFNISFFVAKKDECNDCTIYNNAGLNRNEGDYSLHLNDAKISRHLKDSDKIAALESSRKMLTVVFDFQKVLTCSKSNADVTTFYYKRNFNSYNFTVYCINTREAHSASSGMNVLQSKVQMRLFKKIHRN